MKENSPREKRRSDILCNKDKKSIFENEGY